MYQPRCGGIIYLAFGRIGIVTVRVTGADFSVYTVNQNFGMVLNGLLSCHQTSLFLGLGNVGGTGVAFYDGLPVPVRPFGNVDVSSHTSDLLIHDGDTANCRLRIHWVQTVRIFPA